MDSYSIASNETFAIWDALSLSVKYLGRAVEGDVAEFGTATGSSAHCIAATMAYMRNHTPWDDQMHKIPPRKLHLFDSFEGFPEMIGSDAAMPHAVSKVWRPGSMKFLTAAQLLDMCAAEFPREDIVIHEGWYKDTMPKVDKAVRFGFVHLDCDLYQSTYDVLDWLFEGDRLTDGAVLHFDDWLCNRSAPEWGQQKAWSEILGKYRPVTTDCGYYALAGHKKIYHRRKDRA